jgi:hypothetical protein
VIRSSILAAVFLVYTAMVSVLDQAFGVGRCWASRAPRPRLQSTSTVASRRRSSSAPTQFWS